MLPAPTIPKQALDSVQLIIDTIHAHPGEVTLLVTGPLTNLAAAEKKEPGTLNQCKQIIVMGGSFSG
jgi:inosine-uridine nucleoside N-ribohydrolase